MARDGSASLAYQEIGTGGGGAAVPRRLALHALFTILLVAALIFLAVTLASMAFFAWMERRSSRGVRRAR